MPDMMVACPDCGEMVAAPALGEHVCDPAQVTVHQHDSIFQQATDAIADLPTTNGDTAVTDTPPIPPAPTEPVVDHAQRVQIGGVIGYVAQIMDRMVTDPQGPNVPTPWPEGPDTAHLDFAAVVVMVLADVLELPADALQTISTGLMQTEGDVPRITADEPTEQGPGGEPTNDERGTENDGSS